MNEGKGREQLTSFIASFFSRLAIAINCASWLKRNVDIAVVKLPIVLVGFGWALLLVPANASAEYIFTNPEFELDNHLHFSDKYVMRGNGAYPIAIHPLVPAIARPAPLNPPSSRHRLRHRR